jgi:hypothetical protein
LFTSGARASAAVAARRARAPARRVE